MLYKSIHYKNATIEWERWSEWSNYTETITAFITLCLQYFTV